jgi:hypothetical protein
MVVVDGVLWRGCGGGGYEGGWELEAVAGGFRMIDSVSY